MHASTNSTHPPPALPLTTQSPSQSRGGRRDLSRRYLELQTVSSHSLDGGTSHRDSSFTAAGLKHAEVAQNTKGLVRLNVGGVHYTTSAATLCSVEGSYLASLFSGRCGRVQCKAWLGAALHRASWNVTVLHRSARHGTS